MKKLHKGLLLAGALLLLVILLSLTSLLMLRKADQLVSEDARDMLNEIATQLEMRLQSAIASEIASLEFQAHFISRYADIQDPRVMHILREEVDAASFIRLGVILPDGNSVNTDGYVVNLAHREYFKKAMAGIPNISDVLRHTQDPDELIMAIAVPIRRGEEVVGVLRGARFVDEYARLLQITTYGSVGYASVVKRTGEVVLANSSDKGDVLATSVPYVALPEYSEDPSLRVMSASMARGERGMIRHGQGDARRFVDYRPLGINDWYVVTVVMETRMMGKVTTILKSTSRAFIIVTAILLLTLALFVIFRERRQALLERIAFVDSLTQLGTWERLLFETRHRLKDYARRGYSYVLIDIDKLKLINTSAGFPVGDLILKSMGRILLRCVESDELVVRVVNDRFAMLLRSEGPIGSRVGMILDKLNGLLFEEPLASRTTISLTFSCGIYPLSEDDVSIQTVHDNAQIALETVKKHRITTYAYYDAALHRNMQRQQELARRFSHAISRREFIIHLQPKFRLADGRIVGAESLVRWNHPDLGLLPPSDFIGMLEEDGRIVELDAFVMREVCSLLVKWKHMGLDPLPIAVNISRVDAMSEQFAEQLDAIADEYGIQRSLMEFELTETAFSDQPERMLATVKRLQGFGFTVAIDDFGSGYSSLHLLKDLSVDTIKIDREFLKDLSSLKRSETVLKHILELARDLGMTVVAEGVEAQAQLEFLRAAGCHQAQGYFLSRPLPIGEFESRYPV